MSREQLFRQPDFVPVFDQFASFVGQRVCITGHRGILGSLAMSRFVAHGVAVAAFPGDVGDGDAVTAWVQLECPDLLFHFAARVPVVEVERAPLSAYETNVLGTFNVARAVITARPQCWLFLCSSSHVYQPAPVSETSPIRVGDREVPSTFYGASKLAGERIVRPVLERFGVSCCIGRVFSFTHITQREPYLVPSLRRRIRELPPGAALEIASAEAIRDILDAETVIDCVLHLARLRAVGTLNIGSGRGMSVTDIAQHVALALGRSVTVAALPHGVPDALVADVADLRRLLAGASS